MNTAYEIEKLIQFGLAQKLIGPLDAYVARNTLLDLFGLAEPCKDEINQNELPKLPTKILDTLLNCAAEAGLYDKEVHALRVNFEARIMGALMPRESEICAEFNRLYKEQSPKAATDYFYQLCIVSNYIRTAEIAKNISWIYESRYGDMEITINLTKPEKDPKTIALERLQPSASYPKCMLCVENIGYAGRINFPARQSHRIVPLTLSKERWYLQYSPYVYYNEHCIVFAEKHEPMKIDHDGFCRLFDFVRQFPHYTCGSNADLPIVGGSILSHNHFQGGNYRFPMQNARPMAAYRSQEFENLTIERINWPVSTLRITGKDAQELIRFADKTLAAFKNWSDESVDIFAFTCENGEQIPHNTITPILHYEEDCGYILDLALRNNCTSAQYPDGIFHPHAELHHIKKENIGLIEVMGLAILPSRLKTQCEEISRVLTGEATAQSVSLAYPEHANWIGELTRRYENLSQNAATKVLHNEIGAKFAACLENAGVFKLNQEGAAACDRFMAAMGCERI